MEFVDLDWKAVFDNLLAPAISTAEIMQREQKMRGGRIDFRRAGAQAGQDRKPTQPVPPDKERPPKDLPTDEPNPPPIDDPRPRKPKRIAQRR